MSNLLTSRQAEELYVPPNPPFPIRRALPLIAC